MERKIAIYLTFLFCFGISIGNAAVEVGFVYLGDKGDFTTPALEFAENTFKTKQLAKADLKSATFKQFGVVWWHDGDADPGGLSAAEIDAFLDYAESGGAVLLTGAAIRYATLLGLENAEPRKFGPIVDDGSNVGIIVLKETLELGLVDGLENVDGKTPKVEDWIQVNSTGFPVSGTILTRFGRILRRLHMLGRAGPITPIESQRSATGKPAAVKSST